MDEIKRILIKETIQGWVSTMKRNKITQVKLAELTNISRIAINRIMRGRSQNIRTENFKKINAILGE